MSALVWKPFHIFPKERICYKSIKSFSGLDLKMCCQKQVFCEYFHLTLQNKILHKMLSNVIFCHVANCVANVFLVLGERCCKLQWHIDKKGTSKKDFIFVKGSTKLPWHNNIKFFVSKFYCGSHWLIHWRPTVLLFWEEFSVHVDSTCTLFFYIVESFLGLLKHVCHFVLHCRFYSLSLSYCLIRLYFFGVPYLPAWSD